MYTPEGPTVRRGFSQFSKDSGNLQSTSLEGVRKEPGKGAGAVVGGYAPVIGDHYTELLGEFEGPP